MKSLQVIGTFTLCVLLWCTLTGLTLAQTVSAPVSLSTSAGQAIAAAGVYLYNPASRTIVCPLDYSSELIMIPWQDFNPTMLWNVTATAAGTSYYIYALSSSAAGCSQTAYWNSVLGASLSTLCSSSDSDASSYVFGSGAKATNYVINSFNFPSECITIVSSVPTVPSTACSTNIAATQWQLVTIS